MDRSTEQRKDGAKHKKAEGLISHRKAFLEPVITGDDIGVLGEIIEVNLQLSK